MLEKFIVVPIMTNAERFSKEVFNSLAPFSLRLLEGLVLLWIVWTVYHAVINGKFEWQQILKKILIFVVIVSMLVANKRIFYEYVYEPIKHTTNDLVNNILSINPKTGLKKCSDSKQAIQKIDDCFSDLVSLVTLVSKKASIGAAAFTAFVTFVIWGLFILSEAIFVLYLVGNTLKLAAISALSPLLILAFAFDQTRNYAIGGLKYVIASALTLLVAAFCMTLVLIALKSFINELHVETITSDQVFSTLSSLLILALSSVYFLKLAPDIASAIMGVSTSSIMSSVVGGAMAGAVSLSGWHNTASTVSNKIAGASKWFKRSTENIATDNTSGKSNTTRDKFADNYQPIKE